MCILTVGNPYVRRSGGKKFLPSRKRTIEDPVFSSGTAPLRMGKALTFAGSSAYEIYVPLKLPAAGRENLRSFREMNIRDL